MSKRARVEVDQKSDEAPVVIRMPPQQTEAPRSRIFAVEPDDEKEMKSVSLPIETPGQFSQRVENSRAVLQANRFINNEQFELFTMLPISDAAKQAWLRRVAITPGPGLRVRAHG